MGRLIIGCAMGVALSGNGPAWTAADLNQRLLSAHNAERARMGIAPLKWSNELAAHAAKWADHLSSLPDIEHDQSLDVEGENLWRGTKGAYSPEDMVTLWIDEKKAFKFGKIPDISITGDFEDVGHYTQLVWRSTTEVGCAVRTAGDDEILVCRYMEGGNVMGEVPY